MTKNIHFKAGKWKLNINIKLTKDLAISTLTSDTRSIKIYTCIAIQKLTITKAEPYKMNPRSVTHITHACSSSTFIEIKCVKPFTFSNWEMEPMLISEMWNLGQNLYLAYFGYIHLFSWRPIFMDWGKMFFMDLLKYA